MGYIGNYYRWFNVPEAPFGWPYELYAYWSQISTVPPWLRLPAFAMGGVSWMLISREVMPRLGREVRRSGAAGWAAAGVFLAFWLPYNNGLRLEPVVAIGSLLVLCAVERAVATRRLLPLALGLIAAAFTVAATPTGFIAVAPLLVALRPLVRLVHQHVAASGRAAVLGPILGAGFLVLVVIFADQTLAGVLEATRIRTEIGPNLSWFQEPLRYQWLFSDMPDGALARRFPVLMLLLCLGTSLVVLLRRGGIPGAGLGPSRRLIGTAGTALALLALTPTKWTHHFGAFASIGAALAALTALATSANVLRSARNRWWFLCGMLVILAMSATGPNAPWYVSQYGVPWFDKPPSLHGIQASTLLIVGAVLAAFIAVIEGLRHEPGGPPPPVPDRRSGRRALRIASRSRCSAGCWCSPKSPSWSRPCTSSATATAWPQPTSPTSRGTAATSPTRWPWSLTGAPVRCVPCTERCWPISRYSAVSSSTTSPSRNLRTPTPYPARVTGRTARVPAVIACPSPAATATTLTTRSRLHHRVSAARRSRSGAASTQIALAPATFVPPGMRCPSQLDKAGHQWWSQ
jgi:arabinosyltransferase C